MDFEWVDAKAGRNLSKHGVSFEEAAAVFGDPDHFDVEDHFPAFGISDNARAVTLNHACRDRILAMFEHDLWRHGIWRRRASGVCWHLTIAVPPQSVAELSALLVSVGGMSAELDAAVARAVGRGDPCFSVGAVCACSLYRQGASDADRIRRKAARDGWSAAKLARAVAGADDWSGLAPIVREGLASVAERGVGRQRSCSGWAGACWCPCPPPKL